jgi:hypothetical protein
MRQYDGNMKFDSATKNRAEQVSKTKSDFKKKNISIVDVDTAILQYLENKNLTVTVNGEKKNVPIIYGSPERWKQAGENGYIKDQKGQVQVPLIIFKRNSLGRNNQLINKFNRNQYITYTTGYSRKNRFDNFSRQNDLKPKQEIFKVRVGDYVSLDYEFIIWTEFVAHTNELIETLNWNSDEYWGIDNGPKFRSYIDSFNTTNELSSGEDRLVRTNFDLNVSAYLLPEFIDDADDEQVIKSYTAQKTVLFTETTDDISNIDQQQQTFNAPNQIGALFSEDAFDNNATQREKNAEFDAVLEFISYFDTRTATITSPSTAVFENTVALQTPDVQYLQFDDEDLYQIFVNGVFVPSTVWDITFESNSILFTFNTSLLNYELDLSVDVVTGIGKFKDA